MFACQTPTFGLTAHAGGRHPRLFIPTDVSRRFADVPELTILVDPSTILECTISAALNDTSQRGCQILESAVAGCCATLLQTHLTPHMIAFTNPLARLLSCEREGGLISAGRLAS